MIFRNKKYWITGTLIAFTGVLIVKLLNGFFAPDIQPIVKTTGILIAMFGLFYITLGTRRIKEKRISKDEVEDGKI